MWKWLLLVAMTFISPLEGYDEPPIFIDHGVKPGTSGCVDLDQKCAVWASQGECQTNAAWMMGNCRRSCQSCQGGDRAWKLRNELSAKYDNKSSTAVNFTVNEVSVKSVRLDHVEMMEREQMMKIHGKLVLSWNDTRLQWDKNVWGLSWLNFYWIQIWTPKLVQKNAPTGKPAEISGKVLAANYTGEAFMWADFSFIAPCAFEYSAYPSDKQRCCFKLDDKRHYVVKFRVSDRAKKSLFESAPKTHSSGWLVENAEIIENKYQIQVMSEWANDPFAIESTNCDMCVSVRRNGAYWSGVVGGSAAVAVVALGSFLVGSFWNQLVFLISALFLQFLHNILLLSQLPPATGGSPNIVKFGNFNLIMILIMLGVTVILLNISLLKSSIPPPHCCQLVINLLERILPCLRVEAEEKLGDPTVTQNGADAPHATPGKEVSHWLPLARAIKFILFLLFLVLYLLVMIGCFAV